MQRSRPVSAPAPRTSKAHKRSALPKHQSPGAIGQANPVGRSRPSTACATGKVVQCVGLHESASTAGDTGDSTHQSLGLQKVQHGNCGNVHGTGAMLGPNVPNPMEDADLDSDLSHLYIVTHSPKSTQRRADHVPQSTSSKLERATLDITVSDRLTGEPVVGATVLVASTESLSSGRIANSGSTSAQNTKSDMHGAVVCRILAHRQYVTFPNDSDEYICIAHKENNRLERATAQLSRYRQTNNGF